MSVVKERFELEYILFTSPSILFNRLSSPSGLSEWFADDVNVDGKKYTFIWKGVKQVAEEVIRKENKLIRYKWVDDEDDAYFEFKINVDELTGDTALIITDFCEPEELEEAEKLWSNQIELLKHGLGSH